MKYIKGFKFRIYPNKKQREMIGLTWECARFVYNHFLAVRKERWVKKRESLTYEKSSRMLTQLKREPKFAWLHSADSEALREALKDLDGVFQKFCERQSGILRFKSKNIHNRTYRTRNVRIDDGHIKLPKLGLVKAKLSRSFDGRILHATVRHAASGKYFVSLCVEMDVDDLLRKNNGGQIGIDVGLKNFYTDDQGHAVANPHALQKLERKLRRLQKRMTRKVKGSKNREKARVKFARMHERIANIRKDFLQKESTRLVKENQLIAVEDLKIKSMMKDHKYAKAIADASWGEFFRMLKYKAMLHGCDIVKVDAFYPSSQICSCCGHRNTDLKNLAIRHWICPACGCHHDRDVNAAKNILHKALEIQKIS